MRYIKMFSKAHLTKGHGVLSAHDEQVSLIKNYLFNDFKVIEKGRSNCHIQHFHTINPGYLVQAWIGKLKRRKNVGYVHFLPETLKNSIHLPRPIQQLFYKYVLFFYRQMDSLVTVNPYFIDVLEKYGIPRSRITYIPNVVSSKRFYALPSSDCLKARAYFNIEPNVFTVLCAGQLQKRKGVLDFIQIADALPHIQFIWAGDFSFGKISSDYDLIKKAVAAPPKNVKFLGLVDHNKMNLLYNACDMMLLPSYEELFPMTILEAMNCHKPILVRHLDIYDNILFDYVQYANTNDDFVHYIKRLSEDKQFYKQCSEKASSGSTKYNEPSIAAMWLKYYNSLS